LDSLISGNLDSVIIPPHIELRDTKKGKGVFTKIQLMAGQDVLKFERPVLRSNNLAKITAIQIDEDSYLDTNPIEIRDFLNHSCDPNCRVDVQNMTLVAIRKIAGGEELTFHYCTTEFDLFAKKESFDCVCGSSNCLGMIKGFNHLSNEQKITLRHLLVPYLLKKV
jgi:hypothetical protein